MPPRRSFYALVTELYISVGSQEGPSSQPNMRQRPGTITKVHRNTHDGAASATPSCVFPFPLEPWSLLVLCLFFLLSIPLTNPWQQNKNRYHRWKPERRGAKITAGMVFPTLVVRIKQWYDKNRNEAYRTPARHPR